MNRRSLLHPNVTVLSTTPLKPLPKTTKILHHHLTKPIDVSPPPPPVAAPVVVHQAKLVVQDDNNQNNQNAVTDDDKTSHHPTSVRVHQHDEAGGEEVNLNSRGHDEEEQKEDMTQNPPCFLEEEIVWSQGS
eukprot:PhF_6_TR37207/c0_g1_i3/m.54843